MTHTKTLKTKTKNLNLEPIPKTPVQDSLLFIFSIICRFRVSDLLILFNFCLFLLLFVSLNVSHLNTFFNLYLLSTALLTKNFLTKS